MTSAAWKMKPHGSPFKSSCKAASQEKSHDRYDDSPMISRVPTLMVIGEYDVY